MKTNSTDALSLKPTFESLYISHGLGILHPTRGMNRKEKKLIKHGFPNMKNDQSLPSFILASQF